MCVCVCVCGGGGRACGRGGGAGGVRGRVACHRLGVFTGGGGVPVASACGAWAQREKRRGGASQPGQGQRSACVYGGGWGVGGGGWGGGECVVRGVCGRGANGLGVCAPVCVRCVGCACGCGGGGLAQRHS